MLIFIEKTISCSSNINHICNLLNFLISFLYFSEVVKIFSEEAEEGKF